MSAEALAGFRRVVWADVELQRKLLAAPDRGGFVTLVTWLARRGGGGWTQTTWRWPSTRPGATGTSDGSERPCRVDGFVAQHPGLPPTGFVFHMSRCGSTLVAQMLAAVPEHLVLSEPSPLDSVLRAHHSWPPVTDDERASWLRWMVAALGQARGAQSRLFVKPRARRGTVPVRSRAKLPFRFDAEGLRADVAALAPGDWVAHFNTGYYEGDWSGAALRSVGGEAGRLYPDPTAQAAFADTPLLGRCPNVGAALGTFRCPLLAVRFLRLGPGSAIREHRDYNLGFADGEVRIHVPVSTGPDVEFLLDGEPVDMAEGEAWYLDLNLAHAVVNRGERPRVHLVVDCVVDDWLRQVLGEVLAAP